jgi:hypothetical protein
LKSTIKMADLSLWDVFLELDQSNSILISELKNFN